MPIFNECKSRLRRAEFHREAFIKCWNALIKEDSYSIEGKIESDGTGALRAIRKEPVEVDIAFELGEFFYQCRAALDSAVYLGMVKVTSTDPPAHEGQLYFPIAPNDTEFKKRARYFKPLPDDLRLWIEAVQPYNASKTDNTPLQGINAVLGLLNECARKDRHRKLHIVAAMLTEATGTVRFDPPARVISSEGIQGNLLHNEYEFLRFRIADFSPDVEVHMDGKLKVDILVEEIPDLYGRKLMEVLLGQIPKAVEAVIDKFEQTVV